MRRFAPYLCLLPVFALLAVFERDLLYQVQEQNLFLHTPLFFEQQMIRAGGLLTWAGSYLTQFFYYPLLGAGLLCLLWAFFLWLFRWAFRLSDAWTGLLPVSCLLLTVVSLGYWVYYLKLPGHAFCATLGCLLAVGLAGLYSRVPRKSGLSMTFILLTACLGYPLFGFYGLWAVVMMGFIGGLADTCRVADLLTAAMSVAGVPLICYCTLYHQTPLENIYWAALPVYAHVGERFPAYYLPFVFIVITTLFLTVRHRWPRLSKSLRWGRGVILVLVAVSVAVFWQKDRNFHRELSMSRSMEQSNWDDVLQRARTGKGEPTRAICLMKNLALFRLGRPADDMFRYPEGAKRPDAPFNIRMVHTVGKQIYLQYGLTNYCYRWCMEDGVEYGWTVERLKLMALCSLLNGETVAAQRFLNLLKKTAFHRQWAQHYEECLHNPRLIYRDKVLAPVLPLIRSDNFLTADRSQLELFLIEHLLSSPGATREQQELMQRTRYYYQRTRHQLVEP